MAQVTPYLKPYVRGQGITYKCVTAATHTVAKMKTRPNCSYYLRLTVLAVAADNWDESNAYVIHRKFTNDNGTLTADVADDIDFSQEAHAGWSVAFAVSGQEILLNFVADDTTPVWIRVVPDQVIELGESNPHFYGDSDNNPV